MRKRKENAKPPGGRRAPGHRSGAVRGGCVAGGGDPACTRVIEGWIPAPVTAQDREVFFQGIDRANPGSRGEAYRKYVRETTVFAEVRPPYGRFVGSAADELWVGPMNPTEFTLGERNPVSEEPARWSVYSLEGRWLAEVELPARFRLLSAGREYVAGVTRTDQGTERVEVYRLDRSQGRR